MNVVFVLPLPSSRCHAADATHRAPTALRARRRGTASSVDAPTPAIGEAAHAARAESATSGSTWPEASGTDSTSRTTTRTATYQA